jgi:hypothetical protein
MDTCPPLEEIAAFLDGMLSPEDRERITAHLASCESCYEVFAGAVHFQEEEGSAAATSKGSIVPFPFVGEADSAPSRPSPIRRVPLWMAVAASILIVPALGLLTWRIVQDSHKMVVADLVEPIVNREGSKVHEYTRLRGGEGADLETQKASFLAGAILVDLQMSLERGDVKSSYELLDLLGSKLADVDFMKETAEEVQEDADRLEDSPSYLTKVAEEAPDLEATLDESFLLPELLAFGKWTEAGRLAALTRSPEFFEDRNNRRFLNHLFKETPWAGDDLLEEIPNHLQAIQEIWDAGELTETEYGTLATELERIIKAYDTPDEL